MVMEIKNPAPQIAAFLFLPVANEMIVKITVNNVKIPPNTIPIIKSVVFIVLKFSPKIHHYFHL